MSRKNEATESDKEFDASSAVAAAKKTANQISNFKKSEFNDEADKDRKEIDALKSKFDTQKSNAETAITKLKTGTKKAELKTELEGLKPTVKTKNRFS